MSSLATITGLDRYLAESRVLSLHQKLKELYVDVKLPAHGWDHIGRTVTNAIRIGEAEVARMEIVVPAMLLHDIGFLSDPEPAGHHQRGSLESFEWTGDWSEEIQKEIADCISHHKGEAKGFGTIPSNLEQQVVCDADMLEKVGYIGVLQGTRTFVEFGENSRPEYRSLMEIAAHLGQNKDVKFYTNTGRILAEERGGTELRTELFRKAEEELRHYYR